MLLPDRIDSLAVAVMLIWLPALYEPSAVVLLKLVIVGAVMSRVTVVVASAALAGPMLPAASDAPFAANRGVTAPAPHELMVTVNVVPEAALGVKVQPVAPIGLEKSAEAIPVTDSENSIVYVNDVALVGVL
jgi:hypothetical protein